MAASAQSSVDQGSNEVKDYICNACEDQNNAETSADFYCKQCDRFYCGNCIDLHGKLLAKHTAFGRVDIDKWPVSKKVVDFLLTCYEHKDNKVDKFCTTHSQLCCPQCVSDYHSQCSKVTQISELTNSQPTGLEGLSVELETVLGEIKTLQISQKASIQSLQRTYKEHSAVMIEQMLGNLNTYIDECDNNSVGTSGGNEQYLKEEMCRSVLSIVNEFDNITTKELNEMKDEVISIKESVTSSIHKCTTLHNDLSQFHELVQKIGDNKELCLIASIKCKHIIQQALTLLGKSGKAFNVQRKSVHNVRIPSDSYECSIAGICVLTDGQVLVADSKNKRIKLLNQQYQVVNHWDVTAGPWDICLITSSEVAVAVNDHDSKIHEVQFITVNQGKLVSGRKFQLQHECTCITHHQGDLFVTSGKELYKYSLNGKLICRLYQDRQDWTVFKCAVSPTGDKLYITDGMQDKLLTLARDGTLLATYSDPALGWLCGLHVTPAGQVLVCGGWPPTVLQVGWEGESKLANLATHKDGVRSPRSVCYISTTSSIIVGQMYKDNILVFRVE
ncbi:uncharacterized protein LOC127834542 [Dreissena polymorpha]|uniref:B box-type domain-containing protein n=1 Tax=Dreissena polymorpha TaxID=45954 RepID=A0A9D4G2E7_DREPO|nr:uncharacterized protein LOC127834542 [Dreissena polymorpha]XP_052216459.1 uncharacterized protein LOC127834542 [Dreissena polymorpha]XP_052216460.1 uncharacterized protein LOC127834542 [Dreissena polymorpha]XP_052216461.1 uncharacterized protein LOC127834542 [Dreissena polymorpha]XP_052216462.1 uncharacterized protein LOC127834542 [Dreissena polymorpha]XP_052216463.1 uncharacterized protein LOC127834542 [Dreissena polymorpha]XP_052216464.1 uncharacterized protein LOC127834542 [Dreissena po